MSLMLKKVLLMIIICLCPISLIGCKSSSISAIDYSVSEHNKKVESTMSKFGVAVSYAEKNKVEFLKYMTSDFIDSSYKYAELIKGLDYERGLFTNYSIIDDMYFTSYNSDYITEVIILSRWSNQLIITVSWSETALVDLCVEVKCSG